MSPAARAKPPKQRLDALLVERGLAESRQKAQALVLAGQVLLDGQKADKPGRTVAVTAELEVLAGLPFSSRAGQKLDAALEQFGISVDGLTCLDVGSSTGGFTDCLLQRGARKVHAVDVGKGQLDWKLRQDPRVVVHEGINARYLTAEEIGEPVDFACCDVSFISVTLILPALVPVLTREAEMVILVKPQFEVGREQVGPGGIVRDPQLHAAACTRIDEAVRGFGFETAMMESPVLGATGNKEFLLHAFH